MHHATAPIIEWREFTQMTWRQIESLLRVTPIHPQWIAFRLKRQQSRWVSTTAKGAVLDVGSGHGSIGETLESADYTISLDHPETGHHLYQSRPTVWADVCELPLPDKSVDTVLLLDVLEHVENECRALDEVCRVLRSNGTLLLSVPFLYPLHDEPHDYRRLTEHAIKKKLRRRGMRCIECEPVGDPIETASMLLAIAITKSAIKALRLRSISAPLFLVCALVTVPSANVLGLFLSWLSRAFMGRDPFMPTRYHVAAVKA